MNKLISMTDFVLEYQNPHTREEAQSESILVEEFFDKCVGYANFLKQPLTLSMFVPCNNKGDIIDEPNKELWKNFDDNPICDDYIEATEKILFEGFELIVKPIGSKYIIKNDSFFVFSMMENSNKWNCKSKFIIIEDLIKYNNLTLTQSAIKQIGI